MTTLIVSALIAIAPVRGEVPDDVSAKCRDGAYSRSQSRRGACAMHGGIGEWYGKPKSTKGAAHNSSAAESAALSKSTPSKEIAKSAERSATSAPAQGNLEKVWVNKSAKVYYCSNDRGYGNLRPGTYMSEASAQARGHRPAKGKACK